ncbi:MAG: SDR family oxidoreductase [Dermatophilaceae bacterium]
MRLAGKTVVVTGAAQGQGAAEALLAAAEGALVVATDILDDQGTELATRASQVAGRIEYRHLDVTDETQWQALADELASRGIAVHGLVNNAGIPHRARLGEVTVAGWRHTHDVNVIGPLLAIQRLGPVFADGASIVNVGSAAALTGHHTIAYTTSKWALRGLSRAAAVELGPRGIRVNTVHPGLIDTPMMSGASPDFVRAHLAQTPAGRAGTPQEVAEVVVFLLSDAAAYVNGVDLPVDGGFTAHGGSKPISDALRAVATPEGPGRPDRPEPG